MRQAIDLDTFIYRCGFAAEKKTHYLEHMPSQTSEEFENKRALNKYLKEVKNPEEYGVRTEHKIEPLGHAIANLKSALRGVHEVCGPGEALLYLSGKHCFREDVATIRPYKGNRDPDNKPVHYKQMREYAVDHLGAIRCDGIEADDAVAFLAVEDRDNTVIVTNDKDLDQIPGWHYNWTKHEEPVFIEPKVASIFFYEQILTGDSTDNIEGIPGIGAVKAKKILEGVDNPRDAELRVYDEYCKEFGKEEGIRRLLENARLVRILRKPAEKENLWEPEHLKKSGLLQQESTSDQDSNLESAHN